MKIIPCIELPLDANLALLASDLKEWSRHTDCAIVATQQALEPYKILKDADIPLQIIPGVKCNQYLVGKLDNISGWERSAEKVRLYTDFLGASRYWIELETTMVPVWNGTYKPDLHSFADGLDTLPVGAIWYPGIAGYRDTRIIAERISDVIMSRLRKFCFTGQGWCDHTCPGSEGGTAWTHWHDISGVPQMPILYFIPPPPAYYWKALELPGLLQQIEQHNSGITEVMWYPGSAGFHDMTKQCMAVLDRK
jgi:hypothetical protein